MILFLLIINLTLILNFLVHALFYLDDKNATKNMCTHVFVKQVKNYRLASVVARKTFIKGQKQKRKAKTLIKVKNCDFSFKLRPFGKMRPFVKLSFFLWSKLKSIILSETLFFSFSTFNFFSNVFFTINIPTSKLYLMARCFFKLNV